MSSSNIWARLVYYVSSMLHVLLAVFVGYLISASTSARPMIDPVIFVFVAVSKLITIEFTENERTSKKTRIYLAIALALLLPLLLGLTTFEFAVGAIILVIYSVYPLVDGKAPFDVLHHVLRYFLIFVLGYGSRAFWNETALAAIAAVALFSVAGELAAGLKKNNSVKKSTASLLGSKISLTVIVSSIPIASIMATFVLNDLVEFPVQIGGISFPVYVMPALAIDIFLMTPLTKVLTGKCPDPCNLMRRRELITIFMISLSVLVLFQAGRISTEVKVNSRDYSFDVGIRTFIAGPNTWDVPWIVFDYVNDNNYYYLVLHKDGFLEISQKIDGKISYYLSSVKTQLTPFQYHNFHILLNQTTVLVTLDGEHSLVTTRNLASGPFSILISRPTGFWITFTYSMNLNSQARFDLEEKRSKSALHF